MIRTGLMHVATVAAQRSVAWSPAFRSVTSLAESYRTTTTVNKPSGTVAGDKLIAGISMSEATPYDPVVTAPAGWTFMAKMTHTPGGWVSYTHWYWKDAGSSEPADYSWTHANGIGSALIFAVSGAPSGAPAFTSNVGAGTTATALELTTTRANQLIAFIADTWISPAGGASPPTGTTPTFTERLDTAGQYVYLATGVLATAGATGNKSHTTLNGGSDPWSALLIAF